MLQLIKRLRDIDLYEMTEAVKQIATYKLSINDYFDLMMVWYRDVLLFKATGDVNGLIFKDEVYDRQRRVLTAASRRSWRRCAKHRSG